MEGEIDLFLREDISTQDRITRVDRILARILKKGIRVNLFQIIMWDLKILGTGIEIVTARLTRDSSRQIGGGINLTEVNLM